VDKSGVNRLVLSPQQGAPALVPPGAQQVLTVGTPTPGLPAEEAENNHYEIHQGILSTYQSLPSENAG
jgi:hypothetical protein